MSRRHIVPLAGTFALLAAACIWLIRGSGDSSCPSTNKLVPACGVIWGVATNPNTGTQLKVVERQLGHPFGMVYRFHDLDDQIPTDDERALIHDGRILHMSIDARIYAAPSQIVAWSDVASGRDDAMLNAQARGIASLRVPVFVTFDHEPDQTRRAASGSAADFVAAWRHVHDVFTRAGAANAVWVWVVTGYPTTFTRAGQMWPGNEYVDWISWEAYNSSGCLQGRTDESRFQSFAASVLPFYRWVKRYGHSFAIDTSKPMMISEAGSVEYASAAQLTARWYQQIPIVLHSLPQIRAIGLWDRPGDSGCSFQFDDVPIVRKAVSRTGLLLAMLVRNRRVDLFQH